MAPPGVEAPPLGALLPGLPLGELAGAVLLVPEVEGATLPGLDDVLPVLGDCAVLVVEPLPLDPLFWLDPDPLSSHAAKARVDRNATAITNLLSIKSPPCHRN